MQINLPDDAAPLIMQKAAAAGFSGRIDAYITHLIVSDECEDYGAPDNLSVVGKDREKIEAMIMAGFDSGVATPMIAEDWQQLHARVDQRSQTNS